MFEALKMKAEAFANAGWQVHWARHGPGLLSRGWRSAYPHVPTDRVQSLCGIDFLCHDMDGLGMGFNEEQDHAVGGASGPMEVALATGDHPATEGSVGKGDGEETCGRGSSFVEVTSSDVPVCSSGGEGADPLCPEDITNMWNEFYNCMYWHHFQCFRYGIGSGDESVEGMLEAGVEEGVAKETEIDREEIVEELPEGTVGEGVVETEEVKPEESRNSSLVSASLQQIVVAVLMHHSLQ